MLTGSKATLCMAVVLSVLTGICSASPNHPITTTPSARPARSNNDHRINKTVDALIALHQEGERSRTNGTETTPLNAQNAHHLRGTLLENSVVERKVETGKVTTEVKAAGDFAKITLSTSFDGQNLMRKSGLQVQQVKRMRKPKTDQKQEARASESSQELQQKVMQNRLRHIFTKEGKLINMRLRARFDTPRPQ